MSTSSSPQPLPLQSISPTRPTKPLPSPWSHTETLHLISAYQQKWYSLNRGQLKATQWEDLSLSLSTLCGFHTPNKTATQCRHKIEKLRKRYRAEKDKPNPRAWEFFDLMHALHHGPGPIPALPMVNNNNHNIHNQNYNNHHGLAGFRPGIRRRTELDEDDEDNPVNYTRPIAAARYNPNLNTNFHRRGVEIDHADEEEAVNMVNFARSNNVRDQKRKEYQESSESEEEEDEREERGLAIAGEIKRFAERVVRTEERKMEMMRETERYRIEMEKRTTEMIRESQKKVMDIIAKAFGTNNNKKMKMEMD